MRTELNSLAENDPRREELTKNIRVREKLWLSLPREVQQRITDLSREYAALGGSRRTRKNPVRFVRDHAPHVGPKDLKKLRTLSKRHKLMIPVQTTATSWKTFDPENPPKKVVRVVVDGTHTFEFGLA